MNKHAICHAKMARTLPPLSAVGGSQDLVFESTSAAEDGVLSTDPGGPFWQPAPVVCAEKDSNGEAKPQYRAEIRSRWTERNLYFLFVCLYEELSLNPLSNTASETDR